MKTLDRVSLPPFATGDRVRKSGYVIGPLRDRWNAQGRHEANRRIVDYINLLDEAVTSGHAREDIGILINDLVDYTISHFGFEESLQEEAAYPFIKAHQKVHGLFTRRVADFQARFEKGEDISQNLHSCWSPGC